MVGMISKFIFLLFLLSFFEVNILAQTTINDKSVSQLEKLQQLREKWQSAESDKQKKEWNEQFKEELIATFPQSKSFPYDSIKTLGVIKSPNKAFTFFTWNIILEDEEYLYFNVIKFKNGDYIDLEDASLNADDPETQTYSCGSWFGALYYEIIPVKDKKEGLYYVLLGWDGHGRESTRKIIDVFYFDKTFDEWRFGKPVFHIPFQANKRIIFEYSGEVTASLKYHSDKDQIVFDHLIPASPGMEGIYEFYVPDMSFDALEYRKDKWYFIQNVDVRGNQTMDNYTFPVTDTPPSK